ncbi:hypothetical protein EV663_1168 [Rhodovulum bhavnagarense]|uniref:DUF6473 domain-containing protein n=1 Tax=Rhodovulum bhavnagarense TaxID=992286 RepID=A0A4R2RAG6_9RHOB|nr:DUF6473 family protein [Rhodovulum bhavnagarense]TCP59713.1 hypothetical protein EV663_1168 [Rhodovulum bhavnagarense]
MGYADTGLGALDYGTCRYGASRLAFRGPRRALDSPYCAVVGGNETYGKYVENPFAARLEARIGWPVVNLGCVNAGVDVFVNEAAVLEVAAGARLSVIQAMGAQNLSNRFYVVHPRRNDRFLRASAMLKALFPQVDFTAFSFTGHMLGVLKAEAPALFPLIEGELRIAWQSRMRTLASRIPGPKVLLVVRGAVADDPVLGPSPVFVTEEVIAGVAPVFDRVLRVTVSAAARRQGTVGMVFPESEAQVAAAMPGPAAHEEIARALASLVNDLAVATRKQKGPHDAGPQAGGGWNNQSFSISSGTASKRSATSP